MKIFGILLCVVGASSILIGKYIHIVDHPEWTQVQALLNLWMFWVAGLSFWVGAVLLNGMESHINKLKKERDRLVKLNKEGDELVKRQKKRELRRIEGVEK